MAAEKQRTLLPRNVIPSHYDLHITPNFADFSFRGRVQVQLKVAEKANYITFHANELAFQRASLSLGDQKSIEIDGKEVKVDAKEETATVCLPFDLEVGHTPVLTLDYTGILGDKMKGFYRSKFFDANGNQKWMGCTQFEPVDARRALPCWDEPALKATFGVTLTHPTDMIAVSNMPEQSNSVEGDLRTVTFQPTPIMSTYLLAWVIGQFEVVEGQTKDGVTVRVFATPGKREQGRFALDVGVRALDFYNEYFEIKYPLPKLDMLAIPDFAAGAMENWGCVTYREVALLVDPQNTSTATKQHVAIVVAHEIAHQWFGNLCTMEWWSQLWLNEGFASFVEYLTVDYLFPEWDMWTEFVSGDIMRALTLDSLKNSHPIEVEVYHPSEIDEIFDAISYSKGASVIRMIQAFLGAETFRTALVKYLNKFSYKNAVTEDLWQALEEESGKPVRHIMDAWTKKTGFPVIEVKEEKDNKVRVTQKRFFASGLEDDASVWQVPLLINTAGQMSDYLLQGSEAVLDLDTSASFYKFNAQQTAPFRVNYSAQGWAKISNAIRENSLSSTDRLGVQNDAMALARAGLLPTIQVMDLLQAYVAETNQRVWSDLASNVAQLALILKHTPLAAAFDEYAAGLYLRIAARLGWDKEDDELDRNTLLRGMVLSQLVKYGDRGTINEALRRFDAYVAKTADLLPDLRAAVYAAVVRERHEEGYQQLMQIYQTTTLSEEKNRILRALGAASKPELLARALEFAFSDQVRSQDAVFVVEAIAANKLGSEIVWQYLQNNWPTMTQRFGGMFLMARLVKVTQNFSSHDKANEIEAFFRDKQAPGADRAILQSIEQVRSNANWLQRDYDAIQDFLRH
eukprot:TRINITY_DN957_c0_g2_i1.p1 TRINITY_DN957_c0_g2~~TRINITY_DN957_c0_g2_i1.p1  ORF type:complete len:901 (+),score=360.58 TRINITY_DN957_c0_g2_i1:141-2705(+)